MATATTTTTSEITPAQLLLSSVNYGAGGNPKKAKDPTQNYRFYVCTLGWDGMKCRPTNPNNPINDVQTEKLCVVNRWIPQFLDPYILRFDNFSCWRAQLKSNKTGP